MGRGQQKGRRFETAADFLVRDLFLSGAVPQGGALGHRAKVPAGRPPGSCNSPGPGPGSARGFRRWARPPGKERGVLPEADRADKGDGLLPGHREGNTAAAGAGIFSLRLRGLGVGLNLPGQIILRFGQIEEFLLHREPPVTFRPDDAFCRLPWRSSITRPAGQPPGSDRGAVPAH